MNPRSTVLAIALGIAAGIAIAVVYAVLAEIIQLTLGLLVVGFAGGWLIGTSMAYGVWREAEHEPNRSLRWTAVAISVVSWVGALFLAFVISQVVLPEASTPLSARVTLGGFVDYFTGLDLTRLIHILAFVLMATMAWRAAR